MIAERESFYGEGMLWLFDAANADLSFSLPEPVLINTPCGCDNEQCGRIWLKPGTPCRCEHADCEGVMAERLWKPATYVLFRWKRASASVAPCRRVVLLDLGDGIILRISRFVRAGHGEGIIYTCASVQAWMRDGTPWERLALPDPPATSRYDPPEWERERTPAAWRARAEELRRSVFS